MNRRTHQITWKVAALAAAVVLLAAGIALAAVRVYSNNFSSRADAKELRVAGKGCKKSWDGKRKRLRVVARRFPGHCRVRVPVRGDSPQPDHIVEVVTQVPKPGGKSAKSASGREAKRREAKRLARIFVAVSVRDGAGGRYELRVYPGRRGYELLRDPESEADEFPLTGRDEAIGRFGERNVLRLEALVDTIRASVNEKRIGTVFDPAAREMDGTRVVITLGMEGNSKDPIRALLDDLKVHVPTP